MFTSDLNAGVVPQMSPPPHDLERLRTTMVDFLVVSIKLVVMVLGVSYSRVLAQRPTGYCSASNNKNDETYIIIDIFCTKCCHIYRELLTTTFASCCQKEHPLGWTSFVPCSLGPSNPHQWPRFDASQGIPAQIN